ncbi:MAG: hypothetical protein RLZZ476_2513 [Verrucomicrobiota bacterium]|jgi:hypothetical protein
MPHDAAMPAKTTRPTASQSSRDYFVFDGQKIPLWPIRGKTSVPPARIRRAVRTVLKANNMLREGA